MPKLSARWFLLALALAVNGCGGTKPAAPPARARPDDAFVVRMARHQQTGLSLARSAAARAHAVSVRRLARQMVQRRTRTLPALLERLAKVPSRRDLPDLGVSKDEAGEGIAPDALNGARPLEPAFLTLMTRHDQGTLALAQAELRRGTDPALKALAQQVAAGAAGELERLNRALAHLAARHTA